MTRLTELESERRLDASLFLDDAERLVQRARREQSRYVGRIAGKAFRGFAAASGLSALGAALRRHAVYRRTLDELSQLDSAVLADIGLTRSEIRRRALECSRDAVPAGEHWWTRLGAWVARVRAENQTIRELSVLDARMLRDIGIEPGSVGGTAERMTAPANTMVVEAVSALRDAAVILFAPLKQSRDLRAAQAVDLVERHDTRAAA